MSTQTVTYRVDAYSVELYGTDKKGKRTRWGDKIINIYSEGKHVGQAVFTTEGAATQDSYFSDGNIYYIAWRPVHDPNESNDGDAIFYTERHVRK